MTKIPANKNLILGIAIVATIILVWFILEDNRRLKDQNADKDDALREADSDKMKLINELLKISNQKLPPEAERQLKELIMKYEVDNPSLAGEIKSILNLLENGEQEKAVASVSKIIENLLKDKFKNAKGLMKKYKNKPFISFADMLDYAKEKKLLTKAEYNFAIGLKEFRNEEAHELNVRRETNWNISSVLLGIELIFKCEKIIYVEDEEQNS